MTTSGLFTDPVCGMTVKPESPHPPARAPWMWSLCRAQMRSKRGSIW